MAKKKETTFTEEFQVPQEEMTENKQEDNQGGEPETPKTDIPATKEDNIQYALKDGSMGSRAAFIREKFLDDNMTRKEISKAYDFDYRVVYSATVNMQNDAENGTNRRGNVNQMVDVTAEGQLITKEEIPAEEGGEPVINYYVNGELVDGVPVVDKRISRKEYIANAVAEGVSRGDIAKWLDVSYGIVYGASKNEGTPREKYTYTLEDGTEISRPDYIRALFAEGNTKAEIAKQLDVPYSVVWQATKEEKSLEERYNDAVETLKGFAGKVTDEDGLASAIEILSNIAVQEEETESEEGNEEAPEAE